VLGIFTDGDLRRVFESKVDPNETSISEVMTEHCTTVAADLLAAEGLKIMQEKKINSLLVTNENDELIGALNMHTLLRAGVA
jgi:arabinose-5-phosphate isomerase